MKKYTFTIRKGTGFRFNTKCIETDKGLFYAIDTITAILNCSENVISNISIK